MKNIFITNFLFIILFLPLNFNLYAQVNENHAKLLPTIEDDFINLVNSPLNFKAKDWLITGAVIGTTALTFLADENIRNAALRNQSHMFSHISKIGEYYGRVEIAALLSGGLYIGGKIFDESELAETGRMLIESLVFAGITTSVLKSLLGRSRPYTNKGSFNFVGLQFNTANTSFPSGHTTVAFAISSVLAARINNTYASIALYGLAGLTAVQRVYSDRHWTSDTIFAAAISTAIGQAVVHLNEKSKTGEKKDFAFSAFPMVNNSSLGLQINIIF